MTSTAELVWQQGYLAGLHMTDCEDCRPLVAQLTAKVAELNHLVGLHEFCRTQDCPQKRKQEQELA